MTRRPLSKKLRFEVFKRDTFTCGYCGRKAPDVVLQCDHIVPVAQGGGNDILNLITSCTECNAGKGARGLSDHSTLSKQRDQLAELQEKREQIEMMIAWRKGLSDVQDDAVEGAAARWEDLAEGEFNLSKTGKDKLRKAVKEFGLDLVLRGISEAIDTYAKRDPNNEHKYTDESLGKAFSKLPGVCRVLRDSAEKPYLKRVFYIRGILRGRLPYLDEREAVRLLDEAGRLRVNFDSVERLARRVSSWTKFRDAIEEFLAHQRGNQE